MFVCMFDIYVVIKENYLHLQWTLSHMFIHSKNLVYLCEGMCNTAIPSHIIRSIVICGRILLYFDIKVT